MNRAGPLLFFNGFHLLFHSLEVNTLRSSHFALVALLMASTALSAPVPDPFVSGWGNPVDPDKDCKITRDKGALIIEMPGTDHDFDTGRKRVNAPRLVRDFEGDFKIQVRLRIDSRPSAKSTVKGQPSYVAGGFLIIPPDSFPTIFIRSQYGVAGEGIGVDGFATELSRDVKGGSGNFLSDKRGKNWPFKAKPEYVYLRLERWGITLLYKISSDSKNWVTIGGGTFIGLPAKLKVGLAAFSNSSDPSNVRFDQLKITQGNKKREPWEFVSGWGDPVDPDKDCKIQREKDSLTMEMPGSDHDYDPVRKRFNAPRVFSGLEGDFDLVVRVRIDYRPSAQSTAKGQPSFVSAGFLLIYPETDRSICHRLEYVVSQQGTRLDRYAIRPFLAEPRQKTSPPKAMEAESYAVKKTWFSMKRNFKGEWYREKLNPSGGILWDNGWQNWPLPRNANYAYLRLEQRDEWAYFFISPDGVKWTPLSHLQSLPAKGKLALAAYSTSTEPSKVRFDQLKLARDKKKE